VCAFTRLKALALLPRFTRKKSERGGGGFLWVRCAGRLYAVNLLSCWTASLLLPSSLSRLCCWPKKNPTDQLIVHPAPLDAPSRRTGSGGWVPPFLQRPGRQPRLAAQHPDCLHPPSSILHHSINSSDRRLQAAHAAVTTKRPSWCAIRLATKVPAGDRRSRPSASGIATFVPRRG
jgi:hypothetical protein